MEMHIAKGLGRGLWMLDARGWINQMRKFCLLCLLLISLKCVPEQN